MSKTVDLQDYVEQRNAQLKQLNCPAQRLAMVNKHFKRLDDDADFRKQWKQYERRLCDPHILAQSR